ncbi:MAG: DNA-binding protein [Bacteroidetes bacterium]|nr:DNA-binding protein [Bacteroidota bacterium]
MKREFCECKRFSLESRRYIGCKAKLTDWIFDLIEQNTYDVHSFCDIFAGTGVVANRALQQYERVVVNDFLYSNNLVYQAFFGNGEWSEEKVEKLISGFNKLQAKNLRDNYFSKNFGGKFFDADTSRIIGYIRSNLKDMKSELTDKEYAVLLTSLIYTIDRRANTLGHFDAYIKKDIIAQPFEMHMIDAKSYEGVEIHREDSNVLARNLHVDLTYIDPPYNSRQYSRFYHVYENLVQWKKPKLYGTAMKPKEENMSDYCRSKALNVFTDLVSHIDSRYLVVSYNNTYNSKSSSSANKIQLEEIEDVLNRCGETRVFNHQYNPFNSGKTEFDDHREYLFITEVDNERRNRTFAAILRG